MSEVSRWWREQPRGGRRGQGIGRTQVRPLLEATNIVSYSLDLILRALGAVESFKKETTQPQIGILEISVQLQHKVRIQGGGEARGTGAGESRVARFSK